MKRKRTRNKNETLIMSLSHSLSLSLSPPYQDRRTGEKEKGGRLALRAGRAVEVIFAWRTGGRKEKEKQGLWKTGEET